MVHCNECRELGEAWSDQALRAVFKNQQGKWELAHELTPIGGKQHRFLKELRNYPHLNKGELSKISRLIDVVPKELYRLTLSLRRKFQAPSNKHLVPIAEEIFGKNLSVHSIPNKILERKRRIGLPTVERFKREAEITEQFRLLGAQVRSIGKNQTMSIRYRSATAWVWPGTDRWRLKPKKSDRFGPTHEGVNNLIEIMRR